MHNFTLPLNTMRSAVNQSAFAIIIDPGETEETGGAIHDERDEAPLGSHPLAGETVVI